MTTAVGLFNGVDREHVDDIMSRGERTWLDERGIENAFNCH